MLSSTQLSSVDLILQQLNWLPCGLSYLFIYYSICSYCAFNILVYSFLFPHGKMNSAVCWFHHVFYYRSVADPEILLSWDGMFHLLSAIEKDVQRAPRERNQQQYYNLNSSLPANGVFSEITESVSCLCVQ